MESSSSLSFLLTLPLVGMVIALLIPKGVQRIYAIFSSLLYFLGKQFNKTLNLA